MIVKTFTSINLRQLTGFYHSKNTNRIWSISCELIFTNYPKLQIFFHLKRYPRPVDADIKSQKQAHRRVLTKRCSENMQQIYRKTSTQKCDFNKVALQLVIEIALRDGCSPVKMLHIFRVPFPGNTSRCCFWKAYLPSSLRKLDDILIKS